MASEGHPLAKLLFKFTDGETLQVLHSYFNRGEDRMDSILIDNAWKEGRTIIDRAVDVHIRGLRVKLGIYADMIETVRGVGYRFKDPED